MPSATPPFPCRLALLALVLGTFPYEVQGVRRLPGPQPALLVPQAPASSALELSGTVEAVVEQARLLVRPRLAGIFPTDGDFMQNPDEWLSVAFSGVCFASFLWAFFYYDPQRVRKVAEVNQQRESLQAAYKQSLSDMEGLLQAMAESSAALAERNLEAKRRDFQKFLQHAAEEQSDDPRLAEPFRGFVQVWLKAYEHCSLDPIKDPKVVVQQHDLDRCQTIAEIAHLARSGLEKNQVALIVPQVASITDYLTSTKEKEPAGKPGSRRSFSWLALTAWAGCGLRSASQSGDAYPKELLLLFLRITILSRLHVAVLAGVKVGFSILMLEIFVGRAYCIAMVVIAEACLLIMLAFMEDIDQLAMLEREVNRLHTMAEEIQQRGDEVKALHQHSQKLANLWRFCVVPQLDILHEVHQVVEDSNPEDKVRLLAGVAAELDGLERRVGPPELWCGSAALTEEKLAAVAAQLNACTEAVSSRWRDGHGVDGVIHALQAVPAFVAVRVLSCHNLRNKDIAILGNKSDPYVEVVLGSQRYKTAVVNDDLNPVWQNEEFFTPVNIGDNILDFHVYDKDAVKKNSSLGRAPVHFRHIRPGAWTAETLTLRNRKEHAAHKDHGSLRVQIFFANQVGHLSEWKVLPPCKMKPVKHAATM